MAELVVIGEVLVEIMAIESGQGFDGPGLWAGPYPSGAPTIFADQAARCGAGTALIAVVGEDGFGDLNLKRLAEAGVETGFVRRHPTLPTGSAFVRYTSDGGRDFVFNIVGAAPGALNPSDVDPAAFHGCRVLHVMGSSLFAPGAIKATLRALDLARAADVLLSLDPNVRKELVKDDAVAAALRRLVAEADVLLPSRDDLAWLAPGLDVEAAARGLLDRGRARTVLVKDGAAGTLYIDRQTIVRTPAYAVEAIDPTGAGDACGATFVACRVIQGMPLDAGLRLANVAGALAVGSHGPMEGNARLDVLEAGRATLKERT